MEEKILTLLKQMQNDSQAQEKDNLRAVKVQSDQLLAISSENRDSKKKVMEGQTQ